MPRFAANLSWLFTELPFLDRFQAAADAGFRAVEVLFPYEAPAADIRARLDGTGLRMVLLNAPPGDWTKGERGISSLPGREAEFDAGIEQAISYAQALGVPLLHVMAGLLHQGADRKIYVASLKRATARAAAAGLGIVIEPINRRDVPGYFLESCEEARGVIHEVSADNLGLQFDIYHRQMVRGDVVGGLEEFLPLIRHMQLANPPDRGEPDRGELDYRSIFEAIDGLGYRGFIGCEYKPRAGTVAGLAWADRLGVTLGA